MVELLEISGLLACALIWWSRLGEEKCEQVHLYGEAAQREVGYWQVHLYGGAARLFCCYYFFLGGRNERAGAPIWRSRSETKGLMAGAPIWWSRQCGCCWWGKGGESRCTYMVEPLRVEWVTGRCTYMVEPPVRCCLFFFPPREQVHLYGGAARRGLVLVAGARALWSRGFGRGVRRVPVFC